MSDHADVIRETIREAREGAILTAEEVRVGLAALDALVADLRATERLATDERARRILAEVERDEARERWNVTQNHASAMQTRMVEAIRRAEAAEYNFGVELDARKAAEAERDAIKEKFDHLESEWVIGRDRGDSLVYRHEREAFDKWQRGAWDDVKLEAAEARVTELEAALRRGCDEADYCYVCDCHPSHGHAKDCALAAPTKVTP